MEVLSQALQALMTRHAASAGRDAARLTQELLPTLLERCGDANARNKDRAADTVARLAAIPEAGLVSLTHMFIRCPSSFRLHLLPHAQTCLL